MWCVSYSSPFPVLVAVFRFCRTPLAAPTLSKEWWVTVARTAAIDCCSCLSHERNRRSLRRRALPVPPSAPCAAISNDGLPRGFGSKDYQRKSNTCEPERLLLLLLLLLWLLLLFIQTEWDVRARRRYSFRATLNMDGTALLLRCNNGRYKNEGYEPNGCVHGTSEHWRHERMVSNCALAWKMMLLPTCGRNTTSKKGGT